MIDDTIADDVYGNTDKNDNFDEDDDDDNFDEDEDGQERTPLCAKAPFQPDHPHDHDFDHNFDDDPYDDLDYANLGENITLMHFSSLRISNSQILSLVNISNIWSPCKIIHVLLKISRSKICSQIRSKLGKPSEKNTGLFGNFSQHRGEGVSSIPKLL